MKKALYQMMIELTNGRLTSSLLKKFAQSKASKRVIPSFAKTYKINLDEMEREIGEFESLHEFFIRRLKSGKRNIDNDAVSIVSPVDAVIEHLGVIHADSSITVKGKVYSIAEMLGSREAAQKYEDGTYIIFYLSPSHYHRIHSPVSGKVVNQWTLGEKSYPVNRLGLKYGKDTLSKNYRSITEYKYDAGNMAMVKVGAMFVNSIELIHKGEMLEKGEEMAYFTFGSTVILLLEKGTFELNPEIQTPYAVKVGETVGKMVQRS